MGKDDIEVTLRLPRKLVLTLKKMEIDLSKTVKILLYGVLSVLYIRGDLRKKIKDPRLINWDGFRKWLKSKNYNRRHERTLITNAEKYYKCLINRDLTVIRDLSDGLRPAAMKGLSALAKFMGRYEEWRRLINQYGLKWTGKKADQIFIERMTKTKTPLEIWEWVKTVKKLVPSLIPFLDLISLTGLRFIEAVNSNNLLLDLQQQKNMIAYYNPKHDALEHFKFKDTFLRHSKKVFVSFVPFHTLEKICSKQVYVNADKIQQKIRSEKLRLRFGDIREAHATFLLKFLNQNEIDFLHGRVTNNVFMRNYFNPSLIADLKTRVFKAQKEIEKMI